MTKPKDINTDSPKRCGEVFISEEGDLSFSCAFCEVVYKEIGEFEVHLKCYHQNLYNIDEHSDPLESRKDKDQNQKECVEIEKTNEVELKIEFVESCLNFSNEIINEQSIDEDLLMEYPSPRNSDDSDSRMEAGVKLETLDQYIEPDPQRFNHSPTNTILSEETFSGKDLENEHDKTATEKRPKKKQTLIKKKKVISKYYCEICDRNLGSELRLQTHRIINHNDTDIVKTVNVNLTCEKCNKSFTSEQTMAYHQMNICCTAPGATSENVCTLNTSFQVESTSTLTLLDNDNEMQNEVASSCNKGEVFVDPLQMNPTVCRFCNRSFKTLPRRIEHEYSHTGEKPLTCGFCYKTFRKKSSYRLHLLMHKGTKMHECHLCDKKFALQTNLKTHLRRHTGEKPHKCELCDKRFVSTTEKKNHQKTHTGEKPYQCKVCGRGFSNSFPLLEHTRREHSDERKFRCEVCHQLFKTSGSLRSHKAMHLSEKPHKCVICSASFLLKKRLKVHMQSHDNNKLYLCFMCGKRFNYNTALNVHMKTHKN